MKVFCALTAKNGERVAIEVDPSSSASALRKQVADSTHIPLDQLRLIFRGKMIKDDDDNVVSTYKLEPDCVLHCMGKPSVPEWYSLFRLPTVSTDLALRTTLAM